MRNIAIWNWLKPAYKGRPIEYAARPSSAGHKGKADYCWIPSPPL